MKKALIIFGGWEGHQPKEISEIIAEDLRRNKFQVTISDTLDCLSTINNLNDFHLIVPNWTMGDITSEQAAALLASVKNGTGLAGFHGGMGDAFRNNTQFQFAVGGQFVSHPDNRKSYMVNISKKEDPVMDGLSDFNMHSEQYFMHVDPSNEVLATTTFQSESAPWINNTIMPVVWKRMYGAGRVFYSALGHDIQDFDVAEMREIIKRGMIWAACR